jgi:hypothetical protein
VSAPERVDDGPERARTSDVVAGYLGAAAIFAGITALFYYPGRIGPAAILTALVAAGMGGGVRRFTGLATAAAVAGFFFGMIIAVVLDRPIF